MRAAAAFRAFHASPAAAADFEPTKANDLKIRDLVQYEGESWSIRSLSKVKPGKGGAFVQLTLQHIRGDRNTTARLRSSDTVDRVRLSHDGPFSVLYTENNMVHVMHGSTYEQTELPVALFGDDLPFVHEGMELSISSLDGEPALVTLPNTAELEVVSARPIREDTKNPANGRPVTLSNGIVMKLPAHVAVGETIQVRIEDRSYMGKVKPGGSS
jgi:elongation factor P